MEQRISPQNSRPISESGPILYWMQAAQRTRHNYALGYAIEIAELKGRPLQVIFSLSPYPEANIRHYWFMWQGLVDVEKELTSHSIPFSIYLGSPGTIIPLAVDQLQAAAIITEKAYLKPTRLWRKEVYSQVNCQIIEVETEVTVPIEQTSKKEEYSAATIRRRITSQWNNYIRPYTLPEYPDSKYENSPMPTELGDSPSYSKILPETITQPKDLARLLSLEEHPNISTVFHGGQSQAQEHLHVFLDTQLARFSTDRNDPSLEVQSNLSPYLHFGQISPIDIALQASASWKGPQNQYFYPQLQAIPHEPLEAFLEELIVRRELAFNFVYYNPNYDSYVGLPTWAKKTLAAHTSDPRELIYSYQDLEQAKTHDPYWNACQQEMLQTGKMSGYMRMYWGKKIIEWTETPETAFNYTIKLNNTYELDGRDPCSYAGVAWCFGKHDRPWGERAIFGTVRYMNSKGLERKFNIKAYAQRWNLS